MIVLSLTQAKVVVAPPTAVTRSQENELNITYGSWAKVKVWSTTNESTRDWKEFSFEMEGFIPIPPKNKKPTPKPVTAKVKATPQTSRPKKPTSMTIKVKTSTSKPTRTVIKTSKVTKPLLRTSKATKSPKRTSKAVIETSTATRPTVGISKMKKRAVTRSPTSRSTQKTRRVKTSSTEVLKKTFSAPAEKIVTKKLNNKITVLKKVKNSKK
uniref:Uncharacterized protein n=1 Tax=Strigamia maritima TaxID=126957 RepID=T1J617_STRMM